VQKFKVNEQSEWKQTDGRTDGRTDRGNCSTSHANMAGKHFMT